MISGSSTGYLTLKDKGQSHVRCELGYFLESISNRNFPSKSEYLESSAGVIKYSGSDGDFDTCLGTSRVILVIWGVLE